MSIYACSIQNYVKWMILFYEEKKDKDEERKKGARDDATHLHPRHIHALTPPHTSVHTFLSSSYYVDI